jgi:hypothetical protein
MALDLQQRPAQHGHRRGHTCYETENGRVVLQADPIKNGGITPSTLVDAPVMRFSDMIADCDPTVIICDIEGGESMLFEQVDFARVNYIYIELHRRYIGANGVRKMFDDLHRHDFSYSPRGSEGTQVLFVRIPERLRDT